MTRITEQGVGVCIYDRYNSCNVLVWCS